MRNEVWHPEPVVAGGSNSKHINHRDTEHVGIPFCQQFGNPTDNSLALKS